MIYLLQQFPDPMVRGDKFTIYTRSKLKATLWKESCPKDGVTNRTITVIKELA